MRKIYVLGLALLAVFAFGATMASGASAEETTTTVWLVSGALTAAKEAADIEGTLLIKVLSSLLGQVVEFECKGFFDGFVGPDAEDEINKILNEAGTEIIALGNLGTGVDCLVLGTPVVCTTSEKLAELWPDNLPWDTLIVLMAAGEEEFLDLVGLVNGNNNEPGFDFECQNSNGTFTEGLCEGQLSAVLLNTTESDVLGLFLPQTQSSCSEPGITAEVEGEGLILMTTAGLALAISEA